MSDDDRIDVLSTIRDLRQRCSELKDKLAKVTEDRDQIKILLTNARSSENEYRRGFELRWQADERARKRWRDGRSTNIVFPDHVDLVIWLAEQLDEARGSTELADKALEREVGEHATTIKNFKALQKLQQNTQEQLDKFMGACADQTIQIMELRGKLNTEKEAFRAMIVPIRDALDEAAVAYTEDDQSQLGRVKRLAGSLVRHQSDAAKIREALSSADVLVDERAGIAESVQHLAKVNSELCGRLSAYVSEAERIKTALDRAAVVATNGGTPGRVELLAEGYTKLRAQRRNGVPLSIARDVLKNLDSVILKARKLNDDNNVIFGEANHTWSKLYQFAREAHDWLDRAIRSAEHPTPPVTSSDTATEMSASVGPVQHDVSGQLSGGTSRTAVTLGGLTEDEWRHLVDMRELTISELQAKLDKSRQREQDRVDVECSNYRAVVESLQRKLTVCMAETSELKARIALLTNPDAER